MKGLGSGIYHYKWQDHTISLVKEGDLRWELMKTALSQGMVGAAPVSLIFTTTYFRTTGRRGKKAEVRCAPMDVGHAGQNIHLQAEALGLGTVVIGHFKDEAVKKILGVKDEEPLYIMPVGRKYK